MASPVKFSKPDTMHLRRVFFDIEGSLGYYGDVVQLAYLVTDWEFNIIEKYDKYFRNFTPITDEEFQVHKLSEKFLWDNSTDHFSTELLTLEVFYQTNT